MASYEYSKLIIFGATGRTGLCCIEAAIEKGYSVTVFVRDDSKIPSKYRDQLTVITGDVLDAYAVEQAMYDQQAAVVVLGTNNQLGPTTLMSEGIKNILDAKSRCRVGRISVCLSSFMFRNDSDVPERYLEVHADHQRVYEELRNTNSADWVAVCPPHISDEPGQGTYDVEIGGPASCKTISKHDLANCLVTCFQEDSYLETLLGVGNSSSY